MVIIINVISPLRAMAIFDMLGRHAAPAVDDQTASKHIDQIFHVRFSFFFWLSS